MKQLIIGMGEVGRGLQAVLACPGVDMNDTLPSAEVIHIAFPYSEKFVDAVQNYVLQTSATLVVIHSTVPLGTTRLCGINAVHSPIRGKHPNLEQGIRTFVKFFGGTHAQKAAGLFSVHGIETRTTLRPENTEALKLWDTEIYREAILLNKKIHAFCEANNLDFNIVYSEANETYNAGYRKLGYPEYSKFSLKFIEGPIGGHCVEPNHLLLTKNTPIDSDRKCPSCAH